MLNHSLENILDRTKYLYGVRGGKHEINCEIPLNEDLFQECLTECLKENVVHHIKITDFHRLFQDIVAYQAFFMFSGAAVTISTPPFSLLKIAEMRDTYIIFTAGIVMMGHAFLSLFLLAQYCKYGQSIENESEKILESLYSTPWFQANQSFRQLLIVAMSNSQKPLQINAAIVDISASAATFMSIIKSAYSLLNFLATAR